MTIQKKNMDYETHETLTVKDFDGKDTKKVTIHEKPRIVKTKFQDDQPLIVVRFGVEKRVWWANWTSLNAIIDKYGTEEEMMVDKEIELELVKQPVQGVMKKLIYLKGSLKEDED